MSAFFIHKTKIGGGGHVMNWEAIRIEFEETDITIKDLAEKHGVKPATLRSRKSRENWTQRNATKKVATKNATQHKNVATQKAIDELDDVSNLSEQQKLFCLYFTQNHNATKSYQMAYEVDYNSASASGSRLLANVKVRAEIKRIKSARANDWLINDTDIINEWMKMAFSDISDYVEFKKHKVMLKDYKEVDGRVIQEIKTNLYGTTVKLYDKQKALIELNKLIGGENVLKLQIMQAQLDVLLKETTTDETTEDKLKAFFSKLGDEVDAAN